MLKRYALSTLVLLFSLFVANPVLANSQGSQYLPLDAGKNWVLHSNAWNMDFAFEVTQFKEGSYRVKINNPWMPWEITVFPFKEKVYLQNLMIGDVDYPLDGYSLYYDFSAPANTIMPVAMGKLNVVTRTATVTTDKATYSNCIKLEMTAEDGFYQAWTFAPGVGFVEYDFAGTTFTLNEAASTLDVSSPVVDIPVWSKPIAKTDRVLSIDVNTAQSNNYQTAFDKALQVGMQTATLHFDWNTLETAKNVYNTDNLDIADSYYPYYNVGLIMVIAPIHNIHNNLPADIQGLPLDDPQVVSRFNQLLDVVLARTQNVNLSSLVIGSEIDAYLGADPAKWSQYTNFYQQAVAHIHQTRPSLKVATEFRFIQGYLGAARPFLDTINQYSDVIGVSYYPATLDGFVLDPAVATRHFKTITEAFPQKPIHFSQLGYPSSTVLSSSEDLQALFVKEVFKAWDLYFDRVKLVSFGSLHDISSETAADYAIYFGDNSTNFIAFLSSLGLRSQVGDGVDKPAFNTLNAERSARGW